MVSSGLNIQELNVNRENNKAFKCELYLSNQVIMEI